MSLAVQWLGSGYYKCLMSVPILSKNYHTCIDSRPDSSLVEGSLAEVDQALLNSFSLVEVNYVVSN